ncbi:hypothetical protein D3C73_1317720 [compost metagenome]
MSRFGKKLVMVGIWAGIGVLIGLQFGAGGGTRSSAVQPGWNGAAGVAQINQTAGQTAGGTGAVQNGQSAVTAQNGQTYVYVPVTIDPVTGAYTPLPAAQTQQTTPQTPASGGLSQQEVQDYSTLTPEQILIPQDQEPTIDVLADKTAGLLQQASQKGIRWVVSLFDSAE